MANKKTSRVKPKRPTAKTVSKKSKFTIKQQRFIDLYDGNATQAALDAGYSKKTAYSQGQRLLKNVEILNAILKREKKRTKSKIMSREERQELWSRIALGDEKFKVILGKGENKNVVEIEPKMSDRLKASELLGRSEADFTDNLKVEDYNITITIND